MTTALTIELPPAVRTRLRICKPRRIRGVTHALRERWRSSVSTFHWPISDGRLWQ